MIPTTCATCAQMIEYSLFENERDNHPRAVRSTWGDLALILAQFDRRPQKAGPAWSPTRYAPEANRGNAGVEVVTAGVMDVDNDGPKEDTDGAVQASQALEPGVVHKRLASLGIEHVIHSTHSSSEEVPKFRVVVPFAEPIPAADWENVFPRLCEFLTGGSTDTSTKDLARLYYLPAAKIDASVVSYHAHGRSLRIKDLPSSPKAVAKLTPTIALGPDGRIPHGRHHDVICSTTASIASKIAGLDETSLLAASRGALAPLFDDLENHDRELVQAAKSALAKFGKPWTEPSNSLGVLPEFNEVRSRLETVVRTKEPGHSLTILIWAAHTHLIDRFESTFYLGFKGKTGAGKGTAVESCIALTPNGEVLGETTES